MSQDIHATVRRLADHQAIIDCLHRYTRGVDRLEEQSIRSAFHSDAVDEHGHGTGSVEDFLKWWLPHQPSREATQHFLTNVVIEIKDDFAASESYYVAVIKLNSSEQANLNGGRYLDRLERRNDEWRIVNRVVILEWQIAADASAMSAPIGNRRGTRDHADPSYQLFAEFNHAAQSEPRS